MELAEFVEEVKGDVRRAFEHFCGEEGNEDPPIQMIVDDSNGKKGVLFMDPAFMSNEREKNKLALGVFPKVVLEMKPTNVAFSCMAYIRRIGKDDPLGSLYATGVIRASESSERVEILLLYVVGSDGTSIYTEAEVDRSGEKPTLKEFTEKKMTNTTGRFIEPLILSMKAVQSLNGRDKISKEEITDEMKQLSEYVVDQMRKTGTTVSDILDVSMLSITPN